MLNYYCQCNNFQVYLLETNTQSNLPNIFITIVKANNIYLIFYSFLLSFFSHKGRFRRPNVLTTPSLLSSTRLWLQQK